MCARSRSCLAGAPRLKEGSGGIGGEAGGKGGEGRLVGIGSSGQVGTWSRVCSESDITLTSSSSKRVSGVAVSGWLHMGSDCVNSRKQGERLSATVRVLGS